MSNAPDADLGLLRRRRRGSRFCRVAVDRGLRGRETAAGVGGEEVGDTGEGPGEGCFRLEVGLEAGFDRVVRVSAF